MISLFFFYQNINCNLSKSPAAHNNTKNMYVVFSIKGSLFLCSDTKNRLPCTFFFSNQQRVDAFPRGKFEIIDISASRVLDRRTKNSSGPFHKKNLRRHGHFPNKNLRSRGHFRIKKLKSSAT